MSGPSRELLLRRDRVKDILIDKLEADLDAAIEIATMARQTFDAHGNGKHLLSELREDVLKDVKRLAERSTP